MTLIPLEIFSSTGTIPGDRGIDWGAKRRIVARTRNNQKLLFWRLGHMAWNGRGSPKIYTQGELFVLSLDGACPLGHHTNYVSILEGGRLTAARILEAAGKIDAFFGKQGTAAKIVIGQTLVV